MSLERETEFRWSGFPNGSLGTSFLILTDVRPFVRSLPSLGTRIDSGRARVRAALVVQAGKLGGGRLMSQTNRASFVAGLLLLGWVATAEPQFSAAQGVPGSPAPGSLPREVKKTYTNKPVFHLP